MMKAHNPGSFESIAEIRQGWLGRGINNVYVKRDLFYPYHSHANIHITRIINPNDKTSMDNSSMPLTTDLCIDKERQCKCKGFAKPTIDLKTGTGKDAYDVPGTTSTTTVIRRNLDFVPSQCRR